jgi:alginate O-acetyltransferase complex protein AlgI
MIAAIPILVLAGIAAGPLLAKRESIPVRRALGWLLVGALLFAAHFAMQAQPPFLRMVGLCCVLLAGMKGLVFAEWAVAETLTLPRYGVFSFLWFGMDPGTFRIRKTGLTWKRDIALGTILTLAGLLGCWFVWFMGWRQILVMFVPLSLAFHFGILRILKGALRLAGFPVRTLFPNPLETKGIADFWGRRWNVGYSQMLQRLVGRPVEAMLGKSAGVMAVFLVSGILHEVAITLPVRSGYGLPTLYFTFHGLLVLLEGKWNRPLGKIPALLAVAVPLAWLFPPDFQSEVIAPCIEAFGWLEAFPLFR